MDVWGRAVAYALVASRRAWVRWVVGVGAYAAVVATEAALGVGTRAVTDATYVGMALVAAVGWPDSDGRLPGSRVAMAGVVHAVLALPVWVVASGATDVARIASDGGRAMAVATAWGYAIAAAPRIGRYVGGASLLMAFAPWALPSVDLLAWASPPLAFASGATATVAHVVVVVLFGAAASRRWTRASVVRT